MYFIKWIETIHYDYLLLAVVQCDASGVISSRQPHQDLRAGGTVDHQATDGGVGVAGPVDTPEGRVVRNPFSRTYACRSVKSK